MRERSSGIVAAACFAGVAAVQEPSARSDDGRVDWPVYRGSPSGTQYASLAQINATNVHTLRPAWQYRTGDATERSNMHVNAIVVGGTM